jgi:hypothetical protein
LNNLFIIITTIFLIGNVSVNVTGYSGDLSELKYEWSISDGTINNENKSETTFNAPFNPGTITIEVKISNQDGSVAQGSIEVNITNPGPPPTFKEPGTAGN